MIFEVPLVVAVFVVSVAPYT